MYICTRVKEVIYTANSSKEAATRKYGKNIMKTLNEKLENALTGTRGLVRESLKNLRASGIASTGKNQNRKTQSWTKEVCEILAKNKIPFENGNDAPRGGICGEFVKLTSKSQLFQIEAEIEFKRRALNDQKLIQEAKKTQSEIRIIEFIKENRDLVEMQKAKLMELKANNDKENWQIIANALVQMVCKNDFSLGWSNIYTLIKNN